MRRCKCCPFRDGENEEATLAQNLGCLPTKWQMIEEYDKHNVAISCHENQKMVCAGLSNVRNTENKPIKTYSDWYRNI